MDWLQHVLLLVTVECTAAICSATSPLSSSRCWVTAAAGDGDHCTAALGLALQCQTEHCRTCATNGDDGLEECNSCEGECAVNFVSGRLVRCTVGVWQHVVHCGRMLLLRGMCISTAAATKSVFIEPLPALPTACRWVRF